MCDYIGKLPNELIIYINNFLQRTDQLGFKLTNKHFYSNNKITSSLDDEFKIYTKTILQMDYSWKNSNYIEIKDWSYGSEYSITNYYGFIYGLWWFDFVAEFSVEKCDYTILIVTSFNNFNLTILLFDESNEVVERKEFANITKIEYKSNFKGTLKINCFEHNKGKYYHNFQFIMCIPTYYYFHTVKSHQINFNIPTYYDCIKFCHSDKKTYYPYYSSNNCIESMRFLIENDEFEFVKYMISSGIANLNSLADNEYNFFDIAYMYKKYSIMCYLYSQSIDINNLNNCNYNNNDNNNDNDTNKLLFLIENKKGLYNNLLDFACAHNDIEFIKYLVENFEQTDTIANSFENLNEPNCLTWTIVFDNLNILIYFINLMKFELDKFIEPIGNIAIKSNSLNILNYLDKNKNF